MIGHSDIGKRVTCQEGAGVLIRLRYAAGMRIAVVALDAGGISAGSARWVKLESDEVEEVGHE